MLVPEASGVDEANKRGAEPVVVVSKQQPRMPHVDDFARP